MKNDYYLLIRNKLLDNEIYERVKDYSKERNKVITYYDIGKILHEAGSNYGESIIKEYAEKLVTDVGKKYNERTLYRMRKFYELFRTEKLTTMLSKLTWSHFIIVLSLKDYNEVLYYLNNAIANNQSVRELQESIKSEEYYRLPIENRNKLINNSKIEIKDTIKDPIIIKTNKEVINEKVLQKVILEDIPSFLKSLGKGFTFIENEYRIKIDDKYNYIDILLFNIEYNCYVVIELKVTEYKKEYVGQILTYMNYCDKYLKTDNQNKTLGIILVKSLNKLYVEFSSNENIIARKYILFNSI